MAKDSDLKVGQAVDIETDLIQDENGDQDVTTFRVISRDQIKDTVYKYTAVATGVDVGDRYKAIGPNTLTSYETESSANKETYAFICGNDGKMSDETDGYLIL